jgi:hypothetical protein
MDRYRATELARELLPLHHAEPGARSWHHAWGCQATCRKCELLELLCDELQQRWVTRHEVLRIANQNQ